MKTNPDQNPTLLQVWRRPYCRAFSLIEVTIAMAIAAVALSTLMALLPQGMNTMREAGDEAIMARIHQQILNEIQMANFDSIEEYTNREIFYDSQGEEIGDSRDSSTAKGSFEHTYSVRVSVPKAGGDEFPKSVGGGSFKGFSFDGGNTSNDAIRPIVVEVAAVSGLGASFDWNDEKYLPMIHTYQTAVVKMGQNYNP